MVPYWVWSALTVGVVTAVGVVVGGLVERSGAKWGRGVGILAIVAGYGLVRTDAFEEFIARLSVNDAGVEQALSEASPILWPYLRSAYPDDYKLILSELSDLLRSGGDLEGTQSKAGTIVQGVRRKYAEFALYGDDTLAMETIAASISIAKRLASDDALLCARYSIEGGMAFRGEEIVRYRDEIESAGVPLFKTLRSGMDRPLARFEPKEEDWTVVTDIMSGFGASQLDFQSISNLSATDPNLCSAMIRFLEALNQVPGTIGAALRGAFVRDSAAS